MKQRVIQLFGWYGVTAILAAYGLSVLGLMPIQHPAYFFLNITGSVGVVAVSLLRKNYQPAVLNIVWSVIGLIGLARYLLT